MGIPEGEEREKGAERLFKEIIAENFPNLGKDLDIQVHEAKRIPNYLNAKRPSPGHIILKLSKFDDKKRILKAVSDKMMVTYKGTPIRLSENFSAKTLQARREWNDILKI